MEPEIRAIHVLRKDGTWERVRMQDVQTGDRIRAEGDEHEFIALSESYIEDGIWTVVADMQPVGG